MFEEFIAGSLEAAYSRSSLYSGWMYKGFGRNDIGKVLLKLCSTMCMNNIPRDLEFSCEKFFD